MVSFSMTAALFGILASVIAIASSAASLLFWFRTGRSRPAVPEANAPPLWAEGGGAPLETPPDETPEEHASRLQQETEARERFEDGLRAILGYGNPSTGGKAGRAG